MEEKVDVQKYRKQASSKRRESIMIRANDQKNVRSIKKITREQQLRKQIEELRERNMIEKEIMVVDEDRW